MMHSSVLLPSKNVMGEGKVWNCQGCYGEGWVHELDLEDACHQYFPSMYVCATPSLFCKPLNFGVVCMHELIASTISCIIKR